MEEKNAKSAIDTEMLFSDDIVETTNSDSSDDNDQKEEVENQSVEGDVKPKQEETAQSEESAKNARFAAQRRKAEAEEKALRIAREQEEREKRIREEATLETELGIIKENPYTNEKIVDEEDLRIYKIQKEIEENGGDPVNDLPKKLADISRKENAQRRAEAERQENEKKQNQEKLNNEANELLNAHKELKVDEFAKSVEWQNTIKLHREKNGRWTLLECYEQIIKNSDSIQQKNAVKKTVEESAERISSTPTSAAGGRTNPKTVADMSPEEFRAYWRNKYGD